MGKQESKLIGIAGPTCSGKSTLVQELTARLAGSVATLSFDEYDLYTRKDTKIRAANANGEKINWDSPAAFDYDGYIADLRRLRNGEPVTVTVGSRESKRRGLGEVKITPAMYTIVEGILIFWSDEASALFDRRYFIDIPTNEMLRRRIARIPKHSTAPANNLIYIHTTMLEGVEYYIRPQREKADLILDGMKPIEDLASQIIQSL